jgi:hypothetical protein
MYKPTLHSHTHCQAAQAHATTQAWQRVCLSHRTTKTTDKPEDEKEHRTGNTVLPKWRQKCYYETFVLNSTAVILLNFNTNNPPLRQYPKRYRQWLDNRNTKNK